MNIQIRKPRVGDLEGIFKCLAVYNLHILGDDRQADPDFPEDSIISVRNSVSHIDLFDKCWVASEDDHVLGFCCWDWLDEAAGSAKTILISALPQARRLGVGKYLQKKRQEDMRGQNARDVHTWSDDPAAIAWYRRMFGYQLVGYEPIRHCLHRFHFNGRHATWAIHRGFVERTQLAHLRLQFDCSSSHTDHSHVGTATEMDHLDPVDPA